jgi:hypothetical protein
MNADQKKPLPRISRISRIKKLGRKFREFREYFVLLVGAAGCVIRYSFTSSDCLETLADFSKFASFALIRG